ncbi:MAG: DUF4446 family protein [Clostridia bacterium]|nr:DUF4446 family protein [Clostridia bacterium]
MNSILEFLRTDTFLIIILLISVLSIILLILNHLKLTKIKNEYSEFMKKLGNGKNIDENLKVYMDRVQKVEDLNKEIIQYCESLDKTVDTCIQKIGIVRYNAFKDVGSNLSFTLALLNNNNNGVVLNGIYSRDNSNIYAKPIKDGKSEYILSDEEKEAIEKAINEK